MCHDIGQNIGILLLSVSGYFLDSLSLDWFAIKVFPPHLCSGRVPKITV